MQIIPPGVRRMLAYLNASREQLDFENRLSGVSKGAPAKRLRPHVKATAASVHKIWERLVADTDATEFDKSELADPKSLVDAALYTANIENYIGTVKVPLGIVGPIRINGVNALSLIHI